MSPNERKIRRWELECIRQGEHVPWVKIGSFSSSGVQHRIRNPNDFVVSHLHSNGEAALYLRLAFFESYWRIRTQVPLTPLASVVSLARTIGARMPRDPNLRDWAVLSTDIVLDRGPCAGHGTSAYSMKSRKEMEGEKASEAKNKLRIQQAFWEAGGADWNERLDDDFNQTETANLFRLFDEVNQQALTVSDDVLAAFSARFRRGWRRFRSLDDTLRATEKALGLTSATGWNRFAHAIRRGHLKVDLKYKLDEFQPIRLLAE